MAVATATHQAHGPCAYKLAAASPVSHAVTIQWIFPAPVLSPRNYGHKGEADTLCIATTYTKTDNVLLTQWQCCAAKHLRSELPQLHRAASSFQKLHKRHKTIRRRHLHGSSPRMHQWVAIATQSQALRWLIAPSRPTLWISSWLVCPKNLVFSPRC